MPRDYASLYNDELARQRARQQVLADLEAERLADVVARRTETLAAGVSLLDLLQETDEPMKWRIQDLHVVGDNTTLTAAYKSGKSTVMLNLIRSMADGVPFLGTQSVIRPDGNVAYWNMELSRGRARQWLRDVGVQHPERVQVLNLRGKALPLWDEDVRKDVVEWLKRNEVEVWAIDPAAGLLGSWPGVVNAENDNGVIGTLTAILDDLKDRAGVLDLMLPIHAGRKEQEHARGATKWDDWADVRWVLMKRTEFGQKVRLFGAEGRDVDEEGWQLDMDPKTRRLLADKSVEDRKERAAAKAVVKALVRAEGGLSNDALRKAIVGVGNEGKTDAIDRAVELGWATLQSGSHNRKTYHLTREHPDVRALLFDNMEEVQ